MYGSNIDVVATNQFVDTCTSEVCCLLCNSRYRLNFSIHRQTDMSSILWISKCWNQHSKSTALSSSISYGWVHCFPNTCRQELLVLSKRVVGCSLCRWGNHKEKLGGPKGKLERQCEIDLKLDSPKGQRDMQCEITLPSNSFRQPDYAHACLNERNEAKQSHFRIAFTPNLRHEQKNLSCM